MPSKAFLEAQRAESLATKFDQLGKAEDAFQHYITSIQLYKLAQKNEQDDVLKVEAYKAKHRLLGEAQRCKLLMAQQMKKEAKGRTTIVRPKEGRQERKGSHEQQEIDQYERQVLQTLVSVLPKEGLKDVMGLQSVKKEIEQSLILPSFRPDLFKGIRAPPKGILLYGPPGNGKTMLAKCIAHECKRVFFNVSCSNLVSKYVGDSERLLRALFAVAQSKGPSIVFIDEVDSLLTQRKEGEQQSSRRLKTQFLVRLDGFSSSDDNRVILIAATNHINEIDSAALRRFQKRIFVGLPDAEARKHHIRAILASERHSLSEKELAAIALRLENYSFCDLKRICTEAAMLPLKSYTVEQLKVVKKEDIRPISYKDLLAAADRCAPTVKKEDLKKYSLSDH